MIQYHVLNLLISVIIFTFIFYLYIILNFTDENLNQKEHPIKVFWNRSTFGFEQYIKDRLIRFQSVMEHKEQPRRFMLTIIVILLFFLQYLDYRDVFELVHNTNSTDLIWSFTPLVPTYAIFHAVSTFLTLILLPYKWGNSILNKIHNNIYIYLAILSIDIVCIILSYSTMVFVKTTLLIVAASHFYPPQLKFNHQKDGKVSSK